jgi:hypothetical protein
MEPELSRRVAQIMFSVRTELSDEQYDSFIDRLLQAGSFEKLSLADQQLIIKLEK